MGLLEGKEWGDGVNSGVISLAFLFAGRGAQLEICEYRGEDGNT